MWHQNFNDRFQIGYFWKKLVHVIEKNRFCWFQIVGNLHQQHFLLLECLFSFMLLQPCYQCQLLQFAVSWVLWHYSMYLWVHPQLLPKGTVVNGCHSCCTSALHSLSPVGKCIRRRINLGFFTIKDKSWFY